MSMEGTVFFIMVRWMASDCDRVSVKISFQQRGSSQRHKSAVVI